ncbi:glycoside hydrolase [Aphanothece hegewaldii CCALA 016]|uniref:Glycoside hydrolase n=1 Tax=Aphanothece hegewaldii CCALA 016 TaxID=2107694 RepID=A0A2T1LRC9_9CHRO|nr:glycoside hydrolase family protein [Aphanothece hegewaldii]PSF31266.1 glycoside hydrolase [Aphanothece hegewaldii CCALA 016]
MFIRLKQRVGNSPKSSKNRKLSRRGLLAFVVILILSLSMQTQERKHQPKKQNFGDLPDLAMLDGDPYIRALMRTISASESNAKNPYVLLYGGDHVHNLQQHPNLCIKIENGPNQGKCSTAAGRYQFLTSTWLDKARVYHPHPHHNLGLASYSFTPEYQDKVVYLWLKDRHAWGVDLPNLLRQGRVDEVLKLLSPIWTSLGYGIEDNSMSPYLKEVYQQVLAEEIKQVQHPYISQ